ncbi:Bacterial PH domain protein [uncultured archaeon]|nr:Bacterial PH domain protein [uncultured archaeon]
MLTDTSIPPQFEAVRDKDERILWVGKPAFIPFIMSGIPFLILGLLWGAFDYFGFIRNVNLSLNDEGTWFIVPFFAIHLFPFYASIFNMVRLFLVHGNTFYAYTNKRLLMRSGFWGTDFKAIDYDKISDIEVNVNPIENLLGVGTVQAFSGRTTSKGANIYDKFIAIPEPYEVFKRIKEVSVDIKTDWNYPNDLRPERNPGYKTRYEPR